MGQNKKNQYLGLTSKTAAEYLLRYGPNTLDSQKRQNIFLIFYKVIKEPMLLLLLLCGSIYFIIGDKSDAFVLLACVFIVIAITFYQERKTEKAIEALKDLSTPKATVIRNGQEMIISSKEVVVDDIIVLKEGNKIPADAVILSCTNLTINESLLTGESMPVTKTPWDGKSQLVSPGGEDLPFIFSGTLVIQGFGIAKVLATGSKTEIGKIGKSLESITKEKTLLQKEIKRIVRIFAQYGLVLCLMVVLAYGFIKKDWLLGVLSGLTLAMSVLPEELSVIMIIFLSLGAWRMSKHKVLARKSETIETLGAATVLCVDKTGTITLNRMQLDEIYYKDKHFNIEKNLHYKEYLPLLESAFFSCQIDGNDPLEKAIKKRAQEFLSKEQLAYNKLNLVREYPITVNLIAITNIWQIENKNEFFIYSKGAPENIFQLCHLSNTEKEKQTAKIEEMSGRGLRILAIAQAKYNQANLPADLSEYDFEFMGLIAFTDPIRSNVKESIRECYQAGIRVIMITGDYPGTAKSIANKIGLNNPNEYISGVELSKMDKKTLCEKVKNINIFARVLPEQKYLLVDALKTNGEIIAMTGDGVNDAPAIKSAHIGIAMGKRGTDVARETSDLVLLNDDFSSIVVAIRMGRRIFDNLRKAMSFIFAIHVPIAGISLLPILFNLPIVLYPLHIAFLELIIDPACSIAFEAEKEEKNIMNRPPRNLKIPLFDKKSFYLSIIQGFSVLISVFLIYIFALNFGLPVKEARTMAFLTLVFSNLMLIVTNLSHHSHFFKILASKNRAMVLVIIGTLIGLILILTIPQLNNLFKFSTLHYYDVVISFIVAALSIVWFEAFKILSAKKNKTN